MTLLRTGLGLAGLLVAALAVVMDDRRIGWGAIALLVVSLMLRLSSRRPRQGGPDKGV